MSILILIIYFNIDNPPGDFEKKIIKEMDRMSLLLNHPPDESRNSSSSDSQSESDFSDPEYGSVGSLQKKGNTKERPIRMLELCFIGLTLLKEPILCSDLLRFVECPQNFHVLD